VRRFIAEEEYREDVQGATLFLQGRAGEVLTQLQAQMEAAATALEFERAARIRDRINRLQLLQSRQFVESAPPVTSMWSRQPPRADSSPSTWS
jgi:excinuclease ABC subunit C